MRASFVTAYLLAAVVAVPAPEDVTDECREAIQNHIGDGLTGATADERPGIGAEFETPTFRLSSKGCSLEETHKLKKKVIDKREGLNFQFTADTTSEAGVLHPEYVFDGKKINVGTGDAAKAGKAASADFVSLKSSCFARSSVVPLTFARWNGGPRPTRRRLRLLTASAIRGL